MEVIGTKNIRPVITKVKGTWNRGISSVFGYKRNKSLIYSYFKIPVDKLFVAIEFSLLWFYSFLWRSFMTNSFY